MDGDGRRARPDDIERICASLPDTELGISWGDRPTWKVPAGPKGRGFLMYRAPRADAVDGAGMPLPDLIVIRTATAQDKAALIEADGPFFTIDHFTNYNAVLVQESRLGDISVQELREVITDAWLALAPRRLVAGFVGGAGREVGRREG